MAKTSEKKAAWSDSETENLGKSLFELTVYAKILETFSPAFDLDDLANIIIQALEELVDYNLVAVFFADGSGGQLTVKAKIPLTGDYINRLKNTLVDNFQNMTGHELDSNKVLLRFPPDYRPEKLGKNNLALIRTFFNIPLTAQGQIRGVITIASSNEEAFPPQTIKFIHQVARRATDGVDHIREIVAKSRSYIESMVASMTEGVIIFNQLKEVLVCNKAAQNLLFLPIIPHDYLEVDRILSGRLELMFIEMEKEQISSQELQLDNPRLLHLKVDLFPVIDDRSHQLGTALILRDITKLKELDRLKSEFVANVSHELRTPLAIIREYVSLINDGLGGPVQPKQKEFLGTIIDNADRLNKIIDDLLNISKLEAGKIKLNRQLVSVSDMVAKIAEEFQPTAKKKKLTLTNIPTDGLPPVFADADRLRQVIINLLSNAVKFTPEKGQIVISVDLDPEAKKLQLAIQDTGPGLIPEEQKIIFDRFQQVGRTYGPGAKGTGLGLSISRELMRLHGGSLWVESALGQGSKFIISLPVEPPPLVLIIDDEPDVLAALKALLESENYKVAAAKSGPEALSLLDRDIPQLIILDIRMPQMDGYQVVSRLKAQESTAHIPILILSAYTINVAKLKTAGLEVVETLAKPFNNPVFLGKVKDIMEQNKKIREEER